MTSPKSKRTPPPRDLDKYALYHVISKKAGLSKIADGAMTQMSIAFNDVSSEFDLGFVLRFNGVYYDRFQVTSNGWMILVPRGSNAIVTPTTVNSIPNNASTFRTTGFFNDLVVLSPWTTNMAAMPESFPFLIDSTNYAFRAKRGLESAVKFVGNDVRYGIRYYRDTNHPLGRRLIVRWNAYLNVSFTDNACVMNFESVVYENGRIEFRYAPLTNLTPTLPTVDRGFVGIIVSGTIEKSLFRDCSNLLNYQTTREPHPYGGYGFVSGAFSDRSASYGCSLTASVHWPAGTSQTQGSMFVFSPPTMTRKIIKAKISSDASKTTLPAKATLFEANTENMYDDRGTLVYASSTPVNMPTTLKLFLGDKTEEVIERQNVFSSLELTGSISKAAVASFVDDRVKQFSTPFTDTELFESERNIDFYASGSSTKNNDVQLTQPLSSKDKLTINLPVEFNTMMLGLTSTIYYYNKGARQWLTPRNSSYVLTNATDITKPVGSVGSDLKDAADGSIRTNVLSDMRGFGPIGNFVASGTLALSFSAGNLIDSTTNFYTKSVTQNPEYTGDDTELLEIPISCPFLLEKAIIQLPFQMGAGWFSDKTTVFSTISSSSPPFGSAFDFAGPVLTVALHHQFRTSQDVSGTRRNIILSGTITHQNDDVKILSMSSFPGLVSSSNYFYLRPAGIRSFGVNAGAVVVPKSNNQFTGSIMLNCEPAVSNGAVLFYHTRSATPSQVRNILSASTIDLNGKNNDPTFGIAYVNPMGRSGAGFDVDGRSLPGGDFSIFDGQTTVRNSLYKADYAASGSIQAGLEQIAASGSFTASIMTAIPLMQHSTSPYVLMPGDKLILSVAKMRPFLYATSPFSSNNRVSGSYPEGHDVVMITGSIAITLYGSQLRENKEYHNARSQVITSNAIHEVSIGNEPVLDEYDVESRFCMIGSFSDNIMTGTLVQIVKNVEGRDVLVTGSRARAVSATNAYLEPRSLTVVGDRVSTQMRPWRNFAGSTRLSQHTSDDEIMYDSLVPNFSKCINLNGQRLITWETGSVLYPLVRLNAVSIGGQDNDKRWLRSYPFEPHYSTVDRTFGMLNAITTTSYMSNSFPFSSASADIDRTYSSVAVVSLRNDFHYFVFMDHINVGSTSFFGNDLMQSDDLLRLLYGFGDQYYAADSDTGTNYMAGYSGIPETLGAVSAPLIRGWRYGLSSGIVTKTKSYFRRDHFGQARDMLEQRPWVKANKNGKTGVSPVTVRFVNSQGALTNPENTWSSNLSNEATSSFPYFDGETRNRGDINTNTINQGIITFNNDNGNVSL